jgi:hypothetical protein
VRWSRKPAETNHPSLGNFWIPINPSQVRKVLAMKLPKNRLSKRRQKSKLDHFLISLQNISRSLLSKSFASTGSFVAPQLKTPKVQKLNHVYMTK